MQQRYVGRSGLQVSRVGLGTMTWGQAPDEHEARDQLRVFAEAGGTLVDTAAGYGAGAAEELLGALWPEFYDRDDVVLCTKAAVATENGQSRMDLSRRHLLANLDRSLRRLGTDYLDLWLAHAWSDLVPLDETLGALSYAVESGRVRYIGVADYSGWQLARAATLAESARGPGLIAVAREYSLLARQVEAEVLPASEHLGLGFLAWSALGRGVLTAKYREGTPSDSRASSAQFSSLVQPYLDAPSRRVVDAVETAARGLGRTAAEVSLAWVCQRPGVSAALIGARTAEQLRTVLAGGSLDLPPQICQALAEVSAGG